MPAGVEYVRVNHGDAHVGMAEKLLDSLDVIARLQQVRRERMAQHVRRARLVDSRVLGRALDGALH